MDGNTIFPLQWIMGSATPLNISWKYMSFDVPNFVLGYPTMATKVGMVKKPTNVVVGCHE